MSGTVCDWPEEFTDVDLEIDINSSNVLSLDASSKVVNYSSYGADIDGLVRACILVNGVMEAVISISDTDGKCTSEWVNVSAGDSVELRFTKYHRTSEPWHTAGFMRRSCFFDVPSSVPATIKFDGTNNSMPVPKFKTAFGWDANDKFKVGIKIDTVNGSTEDLTCRTRLASKCPNKVSFSNIDTTDTSGAQTHVSTFTKADLAEAWELRLRLKSGTGTTYQEDHAWLQFWDQTLVGDYPSNFPTTGALLEQVKVGNGGKIQEPQ